MADGVFANDNDTKQAHGGVTLHYELMFDAETRQKLEELGVNKLLDYAVNRIASQNARIRFYANCLHPKD